MSRPDGRGKKAPGNATCLETQKEKMMTISRRLHSKGFTLMEVLVAMVIAGTGLLAFATMQAAALKGENMSDSFTTANQILRNVSERVLKNATNVAAYDGMNLSGNPSSDLKLNCPTLDPVPACLRDFGDWENAILGLPNGILSISSVPSSNFQLVTASLIWQDVMGSHSISMPFQVAP